MRKIFTNPWVLLGMLAYIASEMVLSRNKTFEPDDASSVLAIFGLLFPLLVWATTRFAHPLSLNINRSAAEMWVVLGCLIGISVYLVWGTAWSEAILPASWLSSERGKLLIILVRKLIVFVGIPFLLFRTFF